MWPMSRNYMQQNLQKASFKGQDLSYANFSDADLRGADFTDANLTGADFSNVKTGLRPVNTITLFAIAIVVSAFSGYMAMFAGRTIQHMTTSTDGNVKATGYVTIIVALMFIISSYVRGVGSAIRQIIFPVIVLAILIGIFAISTHWGSGEGILYLMISFVLLVVMFITGTIARAAAGSMSNILFIIVALTGGIFAKTVGGGIGSFIMAVSCAMISKRALQGATGFEFLRKIAFSITSKFGTSFRHAELANANFSHVYVHNSDFTDADIARANWFDSKKINCILHKETGK